MEHHKKHQKSKGRGERSKVKLHGAAGWARGNHDGGGDGGRHEWSRANKLDICCAARRHRDASASTTINYWQVEEN